MSSTPYRSNRRKSAPATISVESAKKLKRHHNNNNNPQNDKNNHNDNDHSTFTERKNNSKHDELDNHNENDNEKLITPSKRGGKQNQKEKFTATASSSASSSSRSSSPSIRSKSSSSSLSSSPHIPIPLLPLDPITSSLDGFYGDIQVAMEQYSETLIQSLAKHMNVVVNSSQSTSNKSSSSSSSSSTNQNSSAPPPYSPSDIKAFCDSLRSILNAKIAKCVDSIEEKSKKDVFAFDAKQTIPKLNIKYDNSDAAHTTIPMDTSSSSSPSSSSSSVLSDYESSLSRLHQLRSHYISSLILNQKLQNQLNTLQAESTFIQQNIINNFNGNNNSFTKDLHENHPKNTIQLVGKVVQEGKKVKNEFDELFHKVENSEWSKVIKSEKDKFVAKEQSGGSKKEKEKDKSKDKNSVQPQTQLRRDQMRNPVSLDAINKFNK